MGLNIATLRKFFEPGIESLGYELVHLELAGQGRRKVLRVYIDAPGGILVDDCESVSRHLSATLDVEDPIAGEYVLEVSSPGLDRPLVTSAHFVRFVGQKIRVQLHVHHMGRRRFTGVLRSANSGMIAVEVDGEEYELKISEIDSARLVPEF